jgi:hypothetical protein
MADVPHANAQSPPGSEHDEHEQLELSAIQLTEIKKVIKPVKTKADEIRQQHPYEGVLTAKLLDALEPLLDTPTPQQALKREAKYTTVHLVWQRRFMDAVFGRRHWRALIAYSEDGLTAIAHVVVGNDLAVLEVDEQTGELKNVERAEILARWEGPGGSIPMESKGATMKAAKTSALRTLLAEIGPGGDVTMLRTSYPSAQERARAQAAAPASAPLQRSAGEPATAAVGEQSPRLATDLMLKDIKGLARERRIGYAQLARLTQRSMGVAESNLNEAQARARLNVVLSDRRPRLPYDAAVRLRALIEAAEPEPLTPAAAPASEAARARAA